MAQDVAGLLDRERPHIEAALDELVAREPSVLEPLRYALAAGGKRLRPTLCIAAYRAVSGDPPPAVYRLAAAIELIHTYSLIHDDLPSMDNDDVRRGRPSTHRAFDVPTAVVAGAAAIPLAVAAAWEASADLGLASAKRADLVATLSRAAGGGGMVGGQLLDLVAEGRRPDLEGMERIHRMKTGALLAVAPVLGGMAAGAAAPVVAALERYGAAVGLAFQIADDMLDITATTAVLGKMAGRDTELEKATFPALAGMQAAKARADQETGAALAAIRGVELRSPELEALARYAVERDR